MNLKEIESLIKEAMPDAKIEIQDLAGDGNHYSATVISSQFVGQETCTAYIFHLAKYGDIVNIENGNSYGNGSFIATPTAARPAIFHISSCRALVVVRTVGVAEKITLNG